MYKFNSSGWTFDYEMLTQGGLVLRNVKHDNYNLAKDIRVVGLWVFPVDETVEPKYFLLGSDYLETDPPLNPNLPYLRFTQLNAPAPFDIYSAKVGSPAGLQAKYRTRTKVFYNENLPDDPQDAILNIEQTYIFCKYGNNPAHEPGGVLQAARLFPLIKFKYGGRRVKSIRVDYRFDMTMDLFLSVPDPLTDKGLKRLVTEFDKPQFPMLGGVFRDGETLPLSSENLNVLFAATEKPCLYELATYGLKNGIPGDKITSYAVTGQYYYDEIDTILPQDQTTWDNIHLWPNKKINGQYVKKQISSPGAFHCLHLHWRWSDVAGEPNTLQESIIDYNSPGGESAAGGNQFKGVNIGENIGGPLLDPEIPTQTIRFAFTKSEDPEYEKLISKANGNNLWDPDVSPTSKKNFEDLFFNASTKRPLPRDISKGEHLLFWISYEAFLPNKSIPLYSGTIFPTGLYFAHNPESNDNAFSGTIGKESQSPKYTSPTWQRYPNGK